MNKLTVQLPASLHRTIQRLAEQEGYSVDQFLASAAAEKVAAIRTVEYLRQEASKGRREDFERFLAAVPDNPPIETDRLPDLIMVYWANAHQRRNPADVTVLAIHLDRRRSEATDR